MSEFELPFVKVCGITREADLEHLGRSSATAVGLNLVPGSPRCLDRELAKRLVDQAREIGLYSVLVVRNLPVEELRGYLCDLHADCLQLHGEEKPEIAAALPDIDFIKAISWSGRAEEASLAAQWRSALESQSQLADRFRAFLVDAYAPVEGGGTGRRARWDLIWPRPEVLLGVPLILAGGLNSKNVSEAILQTCCDGVDTASGVELSAGIKSDTLVDEFVRNANLAFANCD